MTIYILIKQTKNDCEIVGIYDSEEIVIKILNNFKNTISETEKIIADSMWHFVTDNNTFMKIEKWEIVKE